MFRESRYLLQESRTTVFRAQKCFGVKILCLLFNTSTVRLEIIFIFFLWQISRNIVSYHMTECVRKHVTIISKENYYALLSLSQFLLTTNTQLIIAGTVFVT